MSDGRKTTVLLYYLKDEASNTAFHLNITTATNYDDAKEALMQYFLPVETFEELRTKFHQRYQYNEETLEHFAMELRVLCSKAYKSMGPDELEDMVKLQFILGVRNNVMRERLIVHHPKNLKEAIKYGRFLEVATRTARKAASPNVKGVFAAFPTSTAPRQTNQTNNRGGYAFGQRENYQSRGAPGGMRTQTAASYSSGYVAPNGPPPLKPITCYTCGKLGHKSIKCRSKPPIPIQSGNFVKGQRPTKRPDNTSNSKPKLLQSNMIVQSDEDDNESSDDGMVLKEAGTRAKEEFWQS